jgi:cysteine-rich repeat protein
VARPLLAAMTLLLAGGRCEYRSPSPDAALHDTPPGASCGNGIVAGIESCDDGNAVSGDGCSDVCVLESQGAGGRGCLGARVLTLVPIGGGARAALGAGDLGLSTDSFTPVGCTAPSEALDAAYAFNIDGPADLSVQVSVSDPYDVLLLLRGVGGACTDPATETCVSAAAEGRSETLVASLPGAGTYYVVVESLVSGSPNYGYQLELTVVPR